ncbi:MAG: AAA family ATPase [Phycisphaerales bacterium]|nr:AAA family ATPase [Phycisphaerales bacterium]
MNNELTHPSDFEFDDSFGAPAESGQHTNPLLLVHRCLRGRYPVAAGLGLLLAIPCAVVGFMAMPPVYTSTGVVNIAPTQPHILYETELNERMSSFDSFVQSQANHLRSQRILEAAVGNEELKGAGWPGYPEGLRLLQRSAEVQVPRGSQDIFLRVTHEDPRLARAAANAVLNEYSTIAVDEEGRQMEKTIKSLEELRTKADQERQTARSRAYQLADSEGTDDLARPRESLHGQLMTLDMLIQELDIRLSSLRPTAPADGSPPDLSAAELPPSPEELALADPEIASLLAKRRQLELELASLGSRFSPGHRRIVSLNEELASLNTMIEVRATLTATSTIGPAGLPLATTTAADLQTQRDNLGAMRDEKRREAQRIGRIQLEIDQRREEAARYDEQFKDADERYQALLIQRQYGKQGRISVGIADTPLAPSSDRRIPLAGFGAAGGAAVGVTAVALFGLVRPRYRYINDIDEQAQSVRIMGAIPNIRTMDDNARELVGASVHQIRAAIDARLLGPGRRGVAHLITSAMAGEGKSTVTARLGKSFAISGKRTLIVDADMVGRKITAKFSMRELTGFADAILDGVDPLASVRPTDEENLFVLPAGSPGAMMPERVSAAAAARLLATLCEEYDAVLVDSGPILGSIEAQAVVPTADEVLLVVSRGTGVRLVRLAIDRLHRLGAKRLGVVFNRATMQDLERSTSFSMTSQRIADAHTDPAGRGGMDFGDGPMPTADSA